MVRNPAEGTGIVPGRKSIDLAAPCGEASAVADGKEDVSV
jgi:hypothetical protein